MKAGCWRAFLFICSALTTFVFAAAPFDIPPGWKASSFGDVSREERITIAQKAIDLIAQNTSARDIGYGVNGMDSWQSGHLLSSVAMAEYTAGTARLQDTLLEVFKQVAAGLGHGDPNSIRAKTFQIGAFDTSQELSEHLIEWGMAFMYASRAYNSTDLETLAEAMWNEAASYQVTPDNAAQGTHPKRNVTFGSSCNNRSVAGGVWLMNSTTEVTIPNVQIGGVTTSRFLCLSAHLAELTHNQTYTNAAILAATFLENHLLTSDSLIPESMDLGNCVVDDTLWSSYTGAAIEGLSVLADVTNDDHWGNLAVQMTISATKSLKWANADGIVLEQTPFASTDADHRTLKGFYVQSLYHIWERNADNSTLAKYLESYIAVQFNALQSTSAANSGYYFSDWSGGSPSVSSWTFSGTLASMGALAAAVGPSSASATQGPQTSPTSLPTSTPGSRRVDAAVIVGAVLGSLAFICLLLLLLLFLVRRRRRSLKSGDDASILRKEVEAANAPVVQPSPSPPDQSFVPLKGRLAELEAGNGISTIRSPETPTAVEVPVSHLVELVYQRLQHDRPPYEPTLAELPPYDHSKRV